MKQIEPLYFDYYDWERKPLEERWDAMAEKIDELVKAVNDILEKLDKDS